MFLLNSRQGSLAAPRNTAGRPYLEITAAILPSSLTKVISFTLGFSPRSPVLVCGTVAIVLALEVFLGSPYA